MTDFNGWWFQDVYPVTIPQFVAWCWEYVGTVWMSWSFHGWSFRAKSLPSYQRPSWCKQQLPTTQHMPTPWAHAVTRGHHITHMVTSCPENSENDTLKWRCGTRKRGAVSERGPFFPTAWHLDFRKAKKDKVKTKPMPSATPRQCMALDGRQISWYFGKSVSKEKEIPLLKLSLQKYIFKYVSLKILK